MIRLYECDICGCVHPWDWNGDCRDDANRYADAEDYAERNHVSVYDIEVETMDARVAADMGPEFTQATHGTLNKRQQGI